MAGEHKTVLLSILGTLLSAVILFVITIAISGGIDMTYVKAYVYPLVLSAFTLAVFAGVLFAREKGAIPGFEPTDSQKDQKPADKPEPQGH
ncbi:MAG: hypothetical protein OK456_04950 [Thaumarchaeota archaeon]|nr:hypothetical protein [Nitrososphaerota archaeon]